MEATAGPDSKTFLVPKDGSISLYLMTKSEVYDFDLSRKLATFALPYIQRGLLDVVNLLPFSTEEELEAFFEPKTAVRIGIERA